MLGIKTVKALAQWVGMDRSTLREVCAHPDSYCEELLRLDPEHPEKPREVLNVKGGLREFQKLFYKHVLLPKLFPHPASYGGVRDRHIRNNIEQHSRSVYAATIDVSSFYPSIHFSQVYRLFREVLDCSPDVARVCTRLCTHGHHLALGLPTSPILANEIFRPIDRRLAALCCNAGLTYSRFVDDLAISGSFPLDDDKCGLHSVAKAIIQEHGFEVNEKGSVGRLDNDVEITKIRLNRGKIDVTDLFLRKLSAQLRDAGRIASGLLPVGLYYAKSQIGGRVHFAGWINPGRRHALLHRYRSINWDRVAVNAACMGLVATRPRLVPLHGRSAIPRDRLCMS